MGVALYPSSISASIRAAEVNTHVFRLPINRNASLFAIAQILSNAAKVTFGCRLLTGLLVLCVLLPATLALVDAVIFGGELLVKLVDRFIFIVFLSSLCFLRAHTPSAKSARAQC
jgi:hypothetical protein